MCYFFNLKSMQKLVVSHRDRLYSCIGNILHDNVLRSRYLDVCMPWVYALVHNQLTPTLSRGTHTLLLSSLKELMVNDINNSVDNSGSRPSQGGSWGRPPNNSRPSDYRTI